MEVRRLPGAGPWLPCDLTRRGGQKAGGLIGRFPTLQIKITNAENKRSEQIEPAATGSRPSTVSKPFRQSG